MVATATPATTASITDRTRAIEQVWKLAKAENWNIRDTYDTQEEQFQEELEAFWQQLVGPHESLRTQLMTATEKLAKGWRQVTIRPSGKVVILQKDKSEQVLAPPRAARL
jgi:hypothetical protein